MKTYGFGVILLGILVLSGYAEDAALETRVEALEARVDFLTSRLANVLEQERISELVRAQQARAQERILLDSELYPRHLLRQVEALYRKATQEWDTAAGLESLNKLLAEFPRANRTGCAVLFRAQMTRGDEQINWLKRAMEEFENCYYDDGTQVGPYARLYLGMRYKKEGLHKKAQNLFEELQQTYPHAVDHKGQLLIMHLEGMME